MVELVFAKVWIREARCHVEYFFQDIVDTPNKRRQDDRSTAVCTLDKVGGLLNVISPGEITASFCGTGRIIWTPCLFR